MKKFLLFLILSSILLINPSYTLAIYNPYEVANNKFGIHIIDENDLESAAALVNSSGGKYGYVTMVIPENDRHVEKWQNIFNKMSRYQLIPIIRLATRLNGSTWEIPDKKEADKWAVFLSSLDWVTKNRYIIIFNEPNHAKEWGGRLNPGYYAQILRYYSQTLKKYSDDFFILQAGFDSSAPDTSQTMDEVAFIKEMIKTDPDIFDVLNGWSSHSYPNPGFIGRVTDIGRGTLKSYSWELNLLKTLGIEKELPVFITETGWPHSEGSDERNFYLSVDTISEYIKEAAQSVWTDDKIVAVTPFILNYQSYPFINFSWQIPASGKFYAFYDSYRSLPKIIGKPKLYNKDHYNNYNLTKEPEADNKFKILQFISFIAKKYLLSFDKLLKTSS